MDHPPDRVRNPLGLPWAVSIAVLVAIVAAQSVPFSLYQPYDRYPDMDLVVAYNALLINSGFPQELLEHTGYLYFLLVAGWFRLLHSIGILSIVNLTALPPVADLAAFHSGWQQIIEAGRMFTIGFIALFAATFATLVRWLAIDEGGEEHAGDGPVADAIDRNVLASWLGDDRAAIADVRAVVVGAGDEPARPQIA